MSFIPVVWRVISTGFDLGLHELPSTRLVVHPGGLDEVSFQALLRQLEVAELT